MSLFLVDAGNARLKWAYDEQGALRAGASAYGDNAAAAVDALIAQIPPATTNMLISNVAGTEMHELLHQAAQSFGCSAWFAKTAAAACGVRNAYDHPERLGVDRWAAMIAAHLRTLEDRRPVCIVDAGTALTVDAVDAHGKHLGGLILPGVATQRNSLRAGTADIAAFSAQRSGSAEDELQLFARDTATAVERAAPLACAALADRCCAQIASAYGEPQLLITGADAALLAPWLETRFSICPNLVFEGLAALFREQAEN